MGRGVQVSRPNLPMNRTEALKIEDPWLRLLYAGIIYEAFFDFAYYRHDLSLRIPAFNFLISGGGEWKEHIKTNLLRDFIRYCKQEYWE